MGATSPTILLALLAVVVFVLACVYLVELYMDKDQRP